MRLTVRTFIQIVVQIANKFNSELLKFMIFMILFWILGLFKPLKLNINISIPITLMKVLVKPPLRRGGSPILIFFLT